MGADMVLQRDQKHLRLQYGAERLVGIESDSDRFQTSLPNVHCNICILIGNIQITNLRNQTTDCFHILTGGVKAAK